MAYGLLAAGFVPKTFEVIREEINQEIWDTYGNSLDLSDRTPLGQFIAIFAEREAAVWELAQGAYNALDPDNATGTTLDNIAALSGTTREGETFSTVTLVLTGDNSTAISSGSQVSAGGVVFSLDTGATLATATVWAISTAYSVGDIRSNSGNIYYCTVAGTSAGSGGPSGTGTAIADGSCTWAYMGVGLAYDTGTATATVSGPLEANAYEVDTIETAVAGWDGVSNPNDSVDGTDLETDAELRIRRENELYGGGSGSKDAIRVELLTVNGVTAVSVFENTSDATDGDGIPPHSIECLVQGGTDQDVIDQIFASKPAACGTYGTTSGSATDSQGTLVPIKFSRPSEVDIYVGITLIYEADLYPVDGDDQVKDAVADWGDAQTLGKDVVASAIKAAIFAGVPGILDVTLAYIGTSASPSSEDTVAISLRQVALYDTSRITVASSAGTP